MKFLSLYLSIHSLTFIPSCILVPKSYTYIACVIHLPNVLVIQENSTGATHSVNINTQVVKTNSIILTKYLFRSHVPNQNSYFIFSISYLFIILLVSETYRFIKSPKYRTYTPHTCIIRNMMSTLHNYCAYFYFYYINKKYLCCFFLISDVKQSDKYIDMDLLPTILRANHRNPVGSNKKCTLNLFYSRKDVHLIKSINPYTHCSLYHLKRLIKYLLHIILLLTIPYDEPKRSE